MLHNVLWYIYLWSSHFQIFRVKYAIDTETNDAVAIKILDKEKIQKQNMGNQIKKEISIMKMVKHKYIVGMIWSS